MHPGESGAEIHKYAAEEGLRDASAVIRKPVACVSVDPAGFAIEYYKLTSLASYRRIHILHIRGTRSEVVVG